MKLSPEHLAPPSHPVARLPDEWVAQVQTWGEPGYRGRQIFDWIHRQGVLDPRVPHSNDHHLLALEGPSVIELVISPFMTGSWLLSLLRYTFSVTN